MYSVILHVFSRDNMQISPSVFISCNSVVVFSYVKEIVQSKHKCSMFIHLNVNRNKVQYINSKIYFHHANAFVVNEIILSSSRQSVTLASHGGFACLQATLMPKDWSKVLSVYSSSFPPPHFPSL